MHKFGGASPPSTHLSMALLYSFSNLLKFVVYKNVAASVEIVGERCVPSLIVINSTINTLESKVSLIKTRCLRLFVVVYRVEML